MITLNLTQHEGTPEQHVIEPENKERIKELLTFDSVPDEDTILDRAAELAQIAEAEIFKRYTQWPSEPVHAMIGGAPFLMSSLERRLKMTGIIAVYAFSRREVIERRNEDGTVTKTAVFKHLGFVEVVYAHSPTFGTIRRFPASTQPTESTVRGLDL